ncbi:MAG TPA: recombinase family protein [Terracidiphilus sp.]|nr:recombinase family protein [Terracidiphilus sp.]
MNTTISEQHLSKTAYVYVRQSTLAQVRHHQESTERQYALREKAMELGWSDPAVQILDRDLGKSGAQITGREDFKTLVAEVSMGQVGAVFALEVSRLARSNLDWHRLLELCALTDTLVIDEDGCYNPADFNDGLLLGLKGTMAQAELHLLRGRLLGGKLNKAKKGELRFPLPVGLCYDEEGRIVLDPDEEVQGAVALVFRLFRETGSAFGVMQRFAESTLRFPKRSYGGAWNGKLIWGHLTHSRVLGMLENPSNAGMYVFGRYQYRRQISPSGEVHQRIHPVPMTDWRVSLQEHHEGYIPWDEYLKNQDRLEKNRTNGGEMILSGPAREGLALLQGLLVCGHCGRALTVRYTGNGGIYPCYLCNRLRREGLASKGCMSFRCDLLDAAIAEQVLQALQPAELELALAALEELEARDHTLGRQWQMRLERAEYEAALAERRYQEVDPSQRLVAATLERRWNAALLQLEELRKQATEFQRQQARVATPEQKAKVLALAKDLPQLWHAPTTQAKDRKRMLRLLIKDITVEKSPVPKQLLVHLRWQGNACTDLTLQLPPNMADRVRYPAAIVDRIRDMAHHLHDAEIADQLRQAGCTSAKGRPYTAKIIQWIRFRYRIPPPALQKPEELTVHQVARHFGVSENVVYYWIEHALLQARKLNAGSPYWITLNGIDERKLRDWVHNSSRIHPTSSTLTEEGAL